MAVKIWTTNGFNLNRVRTSPRSYFWNWQPTALKSQRTGRDARMASFTPNSSQPSARQELLSYIVGAVMLAVLIYGCVQVYDAPFRDCASGYSRNCGKFHTASEVRAFHVGQTAALVVLPNWVGG